MDFAGAYSAISQVPVDWLVSGLIFIIVSADALRCGSIRAGAIAISLPLATFLYPMLSLTIGLSAITGHFQSQLAQDISFLVLEAILFACVHQMLYSFDRSASFLLAMLCGLAATIVVLVVWAQSPILESIWHLSPPLQTVFGQSYRFLWLLGSYLALAFVSS